ncbi:ATP-binding protein [Streptomyces sp. NPDC052077]|uniref:ATP-binding protein n=1 Tax=Streptomyces sp. NPDC052077 TaxID=3154757 RepID=UPI0034340BB6
MGTERDSGLVNCENQPPSLREHFYLRSRRSVPAARRFARAALTDWDVRERVDEALLCVSELVTNALLHGVPPGRGLRLLLGEGVLRVEVHDSGDGVPVMPVINLREPVEGGRGLFLVSLVSDAWGVAERRPGKIVWCEFALVEARAAPDAVPTLAAPATVPPLAAPSAADGACEVVRTGSDR